MRRFLPAALGVLVLLTASAMLAAMATARAAPALQGNDGASLSVASRMGSVGARRGRAVRFGGGRRHVRLPDEPVRVAGRMAVMGC